MSDQNPVKHLRYINRSTLEAAAKDPKFLRHYDAVMARFETEMDIYSTWFYSKVTGPSKHSIAYFSAEYGLHHSLPFYAGGLGILAGDFLKECSDLGIPLIGIGFMYPQGYLRQMISPDGWQVGACELLDRKNAPIRKILDSNGNPLSVKVPVMDPPIYLEVWKVQVGTTALYLIDTSSEGNEPWNRCISDRLYTGDLEQRLRQEMVLGIGGARVLKALGVDYSVLHLNEGHPAFAVLERIKEMVECGMSFKDAFRTVRDTTVFTTHTPVPTGHDVFSYQLMDKYFGAYLPTLDLSRDEFFRLGMNPARPEGFNMTAFAMRCSAYHNSVSKKHLEVTRKMWHQLWPDHPDENVPIDYITNGIHIPSWINQNLVEVILNRYLGRNWLADQDNPWIWELIDEIPDEELWSTHCLLKRTMMNYIQERVRLRWLHDRANHNIILAAGAMLNPNSITIGFAHLFTGHNRADLIFQDTERLKKILNNPWRPVQIIIAGKAHPDDNYGKQLIQKIFNFSKNPDFGGRIAFVEDYNQEIAQYLVQGVDLWLGNPLPKTEACGTSGMKASLNGIPHLSNLDGWWIEGYNGMNGWAFIGSEGHNSNKKDSEELYTILEKDIVPLYYHIDESGIPHGWVKVMKEAIKSIAPNFSSRRMVKEYALKFYKSALKSAVKHRAAERTKRK